LRLIGNSAGKGFGGAAMLPCSELEYGGIVRVLENLEPRSEVRGGEMASAGV
jgi:hypothetical protein